MQEMQDRRLRALQETPEIHFLQAQRYCKRSGTASLAFLQAKRSALSSLLPAEFLMLQLSVLNPQRSARRVNNPWPTF